MYKGIHYFLFSVFILLLFLSNCKESNSNQKIDIPNDVKWARYSIEYEAICIQTYQSAWRAVRESAKNLKEDWAVVLDVDETVLDNSPYQEILFQKNEKYPFFWDEWVNQAKAESVPGVAAFIDNVRSLGKYANIVYITNRKIENEEATIKNLILNGMWKDGDVILCRKEKNDTKKIRREEVINGTGRCAGKGKRIIIALIGDQLHDLVNYPKRISPDSLKNLYNDSENWGAKWFVLPNPMYGPWINFYK